MNTKKLKQLVLDLAIHGKLVPQDPNDEPASELLKRIVETHGRASNIVRASNKKSTISSDNLDDVPFEVPEGWVWCRLGDICDVINGSTVDKILEKEKGQVAYLRVGDMNLPENKTEIVISKTYLDNPKNIVPVNSFIFPKRGGAILTNKKRVVKKYPIWIDLNLMAVNVLDPGIFDYVFLHFSTIDLGTICNGGNIPQINNNDIAPLFIPLPPLSEQKRIVSEIEKWFGIIDQLESNEADLRKSIEQTKKKVLDLAIHGKLVPQDPNDEPASELLKRIVETCGRASNKSKGKKSAISSEEIDEVPFEVPEGWVWALGSDIFRPMTSCKPIGEKFKYIDIESVDNKRNVIASPKILNVCDAPSRASRKTEKGDVLFSMVRPYLRNIAKVEEDDCIASTGFYVCKSNGSINENYCFYLMISDYVVDGLNSYMKGDNSPSINNDNIINWLFPLPPLSEQKRIVAKIEEVFGALDRIEEMIG